MPASDWIVDFEAAVLSALEGRQRFPLSFVPRVAPLEGEVREATARIAVLDPTLEVEYRVGSASGAGSISACLVVRASPFDPEPPPLLEWHPMPRDKMVR